MEELAIDLAMVMISTSKNVEANDGLTANDLEAIAKAVCTSSADDIKKDLQNISKATGITAQDVKVIAKDVKQIYKTAK